MLKEKKCNHSFGLNFVCKNCDIHVKDIKSGKQGKQIPEEKKEVKEEKLCLTS